MYIHIMNTDSAVYFIFIYTDEYLVCRDRIGPYKAVQSLYLLWQWEQGSLREDKIMEYLFLDYAVNDQILAVIPLQTNEQFKFARSLLRFFFNSTDDMWYFSKKLRPLMIFSLRQREGKLCQPVTWP